MCKPFTRTFAEFDFGVFGHMQYEQFDQEKVGVATLHPEFVPAVFASDPDHAEEIRIMLEQHGIPAWVGNLSGDEIIYTSLGRGLPVMVPEDLHDQASAAIAVLENASDLKCGVDDEEEDDFFEDDDDDDDYEDDDFDDLDDLDDDYDDDLDDDLDLEDDDL